MGKIFGGRLLCDTYTYVYFIVRRTLSNREKKKEEEKKKKPRVKHRPEPFVIGPVIRV